MQQVSLPFRIALVAMLAVLAVWFVALRPKPADEAAPPAAPAVEETAPAAAAKPVVDKEPAASARPAKAKASERDLAAPVVRHLREGRAAVVLFVAKGADDRAVRSAVRSVDTRGGRVLVRVAAIGDVARFEQITTGVQVTQAPTTLVIGADRQATAITGYTDRSEVEQAVGDALSPER